MTITLRTFGDMASLHGVSGSCAQREYLQPKASTNSCPHSHHSYMKLWELWLYGP